MNDLPPKARDIAMIFQNYALYPHMNASTTTWRSACKLRGIDQEREIGGAVERRRAILGLASVLPKRPRHLSGGQRQRVAMGRAIVREPQAFLMDEPLSNLDAKLRVADARRDRAASSASSTVTTIYVTHDQSRGDDARRPRRVMRGRRAAAGRRARRRSTTSPRTCSSPSSSGSPAHEPHRRGHSALSNGNVVA